MLIISLKKQKHSQSYSLGFIIQTLIRKHLFKRVRCFDHLAKILSEIPETFHVKWKGLVSHSFQTSNLIGIGKSQMRWDNDDPRNGNFVEMESYGNFCSELFKWKKWSNLKVCLFFGEISVLSPLFVFQPVQPKILVKWKVIQCFQTTRSVTTQLSLNGIKDTLVSRVMSNFN